MNLITLQTIALTLGAAAIPGASVAPQSVAQRHEVAIAHAAPAGTVTSTLDGDVVSLIPEDLNARFSLGGALVAGTKVTSRSRDVLAFDALSGLRRFRIRAAMNPVVLSGGRRVAFLGLGSRDRYANSLWIRRASGEVRRVVRFSAGRGTPGVRTGMGGENVMLDVSFDEAGRKAAIAQGNDLDLFIYDIWIVDVATGEARRLTRGQHSRYPSLSPDGTRVAYVNEQVFCGGPAPGYRAGRLTIMNSTTGEGKTVIADGDCTVHFTQPRWLDDSTLVARRLTLVDGRELRDSDLVTIDVISGEVTVLVDGDSVGLFTVSPSLAQVAYEIFTDSAGFFVLDPATGEVVHFEDGRAPRLKGEHRIIY